MSDPAAPAPAAPAASAAPAPAPAAATPAPAPAAAAPAPGITPTAIASPGSGGDPSLSNDQIFELFKGSLSDEIKGHSVYNKYKNAEDLVKATINHERALTKKSSEYFESDDPTVVAERNKIMGVPESAEAYEVTPELSEVVSEESLALFKTKAHEMNLPQKYINDLVQFEAELWTQHAANQEAEATAMKDGVIKELREAWPSGEDYDKNKKQVETLLLGELGLTAEDLSVPIGNSSKLIQALFAKVVPLYGSDNLIAGNMSQTPGSAGDRIKQINVEMHGAKRGTLEYNQLMAEKSALISQG